MDDKLLAIAQRLGHTFRDERLLERALTHRSAALEAAPTRRGRPAGDNERLEFLGGAVLAMAVSDALWHRCPEASEGELTRMRAAIVNEARLAEVAVAVGVGDALKLGRGEERTGGRAKPSLLADALEATFAAVYLDAGIERAREVVLACMAHMSDRVASTVSANRDEKSELQELIQAKHAVTPRYEVVDTAGPDHDRVWHVEVRAGEFLRARGSGRSKKAAEQEAARNALRALENPSASTPPSPPSTPPAAPAVPSDPPPPGDL